MKICLNEAKVSEAKYINRELLCAFPFHKITFQQSHDAHVKKLMSKVCGSLLIHIILYTQSRYVSLISHQNQNYLYTINSVEHIYRIHKKPECS